MFQSSDTMESITLVILSWASDDIICFCFLTIIYIKLKFEYCISQQKYNSSIMFKFSTNCDKKKAGHVWPRQFTEHNTNDWIVMVYGCYIIAVTHFMIASLI